MEEKAFELVPTVWKVMKEERSLAPWFLCFFNKCAPCALSHWEINPGRPARWPEAPPVHR
jgi:hypothetical protein